MLQKAETDRKNLGPCFCSQVAELTNLALLYCLLPDFLLHGIIHQSPSFFPPSFPFFLFHMAKNILNSTIRSVLPETENGFDQSNGRKGGKEGTVMKEVKKEEFAGVVTN